MVKIGKVLSKKPIDYKLFSAAKKVQQEIRKNISTAILAAFGFMIALVWRDVIQQGVNILIEITNLKGVGFIYTFVTALITTVICVVGIIYFSRWGEKV